MVTVNTILTRDDDTLRTVNTFKNSKNIPTYSAALEKLVQRAERLGLHSMNDDDFDALVNRLTNRQPQPNAA